MATTRSFGTTLTPAFSAPITLYASGDDLSQQYFRSAAAASSIAGAIGVGILADGFDLTIKTNHRPLGQRGSHRPVVQSRAQFVQEDGRVATITVKTEIVFENGMTALTTASSQAERSAKVESFAKYVRAMNAMVQNAILNPQGVENPDIEANIIALMNGVILAGA